MVLLRGGWGCAAARSGKGILQTPAVRYPVFKELPVDMPIFTHQRTAPEARSLMIAAGLSAVGLYRRCKCRFNTHVIYLDTSGICFRMDAPTGAHFLYGRVCSACMISTFFTWESYRFFIVVSLHPCVFLYSFSLLHANPCKFTSGT